MASLDEMWACFSLTEEEEGGAEVPKDVEESVYRLAGRFYMKRFLMWMQLLARSSPYGEQPVNLRLEILVSIYCCLNLRMY